ncbi:hypothetical protein pEaSNUABM46_00119 [Erwinia phage pEa_SNUABM_46]|nr:hypothetical protein pEaSNUABM45_00119 [Erwinia phage pEa_SNUABM_45]QYW04103.1 hypothetical protein pEaSNUABM46_00119 [Erwinia phage pEa_SNUABM_46]QYW05133.1 hypothetical protein pEaSNUABM21_00119 [Erwinia phage pEa_SNUABM_21]
MSMLNTYTTHEEFAQDFLKRINESSYWTDSQVSSLTALLADALGDIGVSNSWATLIAAREAFSRLARRNTSLLANARYLGVDIGRKSTSTVSATIANLSAVKVSYDKYTAFTVGDSSALLSEVTQWAPGEVKTVDLIIGSMFTFSQVITNPYDYMTVALGTENFELTSDLRVWFEHPTGTKTEYQRYEKCLFEAYAGQQIFLDVTTDSGDVEIQFGGEQWGIKPPAGYTMKVQGIKAVGAAGNTDSMGLKVQCLDNPQLQGKTTTAALGGSDETPPEYYRNYSPIVGRSRKKLIRRDEWKAACALYPDVADVVVQGQAEIAPNDKEWQGVVRICVLPRNTSSWGGINPNPSSAQWTKFLNWLSQYSSPLDIQSWNPDKLQIDCVLDVSLYADAPGTRESNQSVLEASVLKLFERRPGMLGKRLALSDITDRVLYDWTDPDKPVRRPEVDYCNIPSPVQDIIPNTVLEYVALRNLRVNILYSERKMNQ